MSTSVTPLSISSAFDGGNIKVLSADKANDIRLAIAPDANARHFQWFCYRVVTPSGQALRMTITNAGEASFTSGWKDYRACASYDRQHWFRVPTTYVDGQLLIEHTPERDACTYAYFAPYTLDRHRDLIARASELARVSVVGRSVQGRDVELVTVGQPAADGVAKRVCWIIARQHPGETMAEWFVEGVLDRLLDRTDPVARALLSKAVFHVVPNMNPDGSFLGHLRVNASGANLNREWEEPNEKRSPEVFSVRAAMAQTRVDFFLDVHGDEGLPHNFIVGPSISLDIAPEVRAAKEAYEAALLEASPDFQTTHGYPVSRTSKPDLRKATNYVANAHGALAMTFEQPFKDTADSPDELQGWSPERCKLLGRANLDALLRVIDSLPSASTP